MYTTEELEADGILFTFEITYDSEKGAYGLQTDNGWYECKLCKEFKEGSEFYKSDASCQSIHGRNTYCKDCVRYRKLIFKLSNPTAYKAMIARGNKRWIAKNRNLGNR